MTTERSAAPILTPDEAGFRRWMAVRGAGLRRKAYFLCGDWYTADDLTQEVLVTVYSRWSRLAGGNVDAYANRVLLGKHVDALRRPWRRETTEREPAETVDDAATAAFEAVESSDAPLLRALDTLTAGQRAVVVLRYVEDLTVDEIARQLDVPPGTVKSRLSRALDSLRTTLGPAVAVPAHEREERS